MTRTSGVRLLVGCVSAAVAAAVVAAIVVLGSPGEQRLRALDARRTRDLADIAATIGRYAEEHGSLPDELSALGQRPGSRRAPNDPETGAPYEYSVLGAEKYQLCAVFHAQSPDAAFAHSYLERDGWPHGPGRQCFECVQKIGKRD